MRSIFLNLLGIVALPTCLLAQTKHAIVPYLNELPLIITEDGAELNATATLVQKKGDYIFVPKEKEGDNYDMEEISVKNNYAHWRFGWSGTGGSTYTDVHCFLLQTAPNPRILVLTNFTQDYRYGSVYMEDMRDYIESYSEKYPKLSEDSIQKLAEDRTNFEWQFQGEAANGWDHVNSLIFDVYEKQGNTWTNRTSELLPMDVWRKNLDTYFPCLGVMEVTNIPKTEQPLKVAFKLYPDAQVDVNEAIFKEWLGQKSIYGIDIKAVNNQLIAIDLTDKRKLTLDCSKTPFVLNGLPTTPAQTLETRACPTLQLGKMMRYEGKIGAFPIEMEVTFEADKDENNVKMTGFYWYKDKKDRFPVEGAFGKNLGDSVNFNRLKEGKPREYFACYWINCGFQGSWMHQETEIAHTVELKLAK